MIELEKSICKLCGKSEANQTGSHLLSAFLVKTMIGERDKENGYLITNNPELDYRRNQKASPIKEDYILCLGCEKRLAYLESYISREFNHKFSCNEYSNNFPLQVTKNGYLIKECINLNTVAFTLMIYSIIWRCSISQNILFNQFSLQSSESINIINTLNQLLPKYENFSVRMKEKKWIEHLNEKKNSIEWLNYIILKRDTDSNRGIIHIHPNFNKPYNIIFNDLIILLSSDKVFEINEDFFDIKNIFYDWELLISGNNDKLKVGLLDYSKWEKIITKMKNIFVKQKVKAIIDNYEKQFILRYCRKPTIEELHNEIYLFLETENPGDWSL